MTKIHRLEVVLSLNQLAYRVRRVGTWRRRAVL